VGTRRIALSRPTYLRIAAVIVAALLMSGAATQQRPLEAAGGGSGGRAIAHKSGAKTLGSAANKKAPYVRASRIDHGAGEPTLAITKKGNVFITTSDGCVTSCTGSEEMIDTVRPGGRAVYKTSDQGKTWKDVTPNLGSVGTHVLSMDPYIYVDERTQRVFDIDLTVACSILSFTDDEGASWITNPLACGEPVNDHQTLFSGPPVSSPTVGYENIVYYCFNHPAFTKCTKSLDGGLTFVPSAQVTAPDCSGLNGHGIVDGKGTVYIPLGAMCGRPTLAISKDEGDTWKTVTVSSLGAADGDPSVAVDKRGNLYYLFSSTNRLPYLVVSKDGGKHWSKPVMVGAPGLKAANLATIDVGDPGKVAIAYYGTGAGSEADHWSGYLGVGRGVLGKNPTFYSGTVNKVAQPLKLGSCGPGRCGRVLDFIDVEIAPNGRAWGAYVDACAADCEAANQEDIHDNQAVVGSMVGGFRLR
jgi:hypothetical protein